MWDVFAGLSDLCRRTVDLSVARSGTVCTGTHDHAAGRDHGKTDPSFPEMAAIYIPFRICELSYAIYDRGRADDPFYDSRAKARAESHGDEPCGFFEKIKEIT